MKLMLFQDRTLKSERDLRSLKKRLDKYNSAKEAISDSFFNDLLVVHGTKAPHEREGQT